MAVGIAVGVGVMVGIVEGMDVLVGATVGTIVGVEVYEGLGTGAIVSVGDRASVGTGTALGLGSSVGGRVGVGTSVVVVVVLGATSAVEQARAKTEIMSIAIWANQLSGTRMRKLPMAWRVSGLMRPLGTFVLYRNRPAGPAAYSDCPCVLPFLRLGELVLPALPPAYPGRSMMNSR